MDKTSILGDAITYVKHLQECVKEFEEQATKHTVESVVIVKKSTLSVEDEGSSDENNSSELPEIEAKVCNNHVFLRIYCEKHKGTLSKILAEVEKLHLSIINVNATSFGRFALDISINAEVIFSKMIHALNYIAFTKINKSFFIRSFEDGERIQLVADSSSTGSSFGSSTCNIERDSLYRF